MAFQPAGKFQLEKNRAHLARCRFGDPHKLGEHVQKTGSVANYKGATKITREEFFALDAHVFVPAALELVATHPSTFASIIPLSLRELIRQYEDFPPAQRRLVFRLHKDIELYQPERRLNVELENCGVCADRRDPRRTSCADRGALPA